MEPPWRVHPLIAFVGGLAVVATIGSVARGYALDEADCDRRLDQTHHLVEALLGLSAAPRGNQGADDQATALEAIADGLLEARAPTPGSWDRLDDLERSLGRRLDAGVAPAAPTVRRLLAGERDVLARRRERREQARDRASWANIVRALTSLALVLGATTLLGRALTRNRRIARELGAKHGMLQAIIEGTADAIYVKDPEDRFILANSACARLLGRGVDEVVGRTVAELMPGGGGAITKLDEEVLQAGVNRTVEETAELGGATRIFLTTKGPYRDREQKVIGVIGISREVTDLRRQEEERLREVNLQLRLGELLQACRTVDESYDVIGQLAPRFFPEETGAVYLFPDSREQLEAQVTWGEEPPVQAFPPDDCWAVRRGQQHLRGGPATGLGCKHVQGTPRGALLCVPLLAHGEMLGILHLRSGQAMSEGVCQRAAVLAEQLGMALANLQLRERLRHQSIRDPLTGLFNRRYAEETLARELNRAEREGTPLAVLAVDVDHFKHFNDDFGHDAGDLVLREIAYLLVDQTRGGDVASRMGGEEFLVMLAGATQPQAQVKAERLRTAIKRLTLEHLGTPLGPVTISVGVAAHHAGRRPDELVRAADRALYRAKHEGRDRVEVEEPARASALV